MTSLKVGKTPTTQYFVSGKNSPDVDWFDRAGLLIIACLSFFTVTGMLIGF